MNCSMCIEDAGALVNCPCTNVVLVNQTQIISYSDGIDRPYTDTLPFCLECRMTLYAWGDILTAA